MGDQNLEGNPFAALFESHIQAEEFSASLKSPLNEDTSGTTPLHLQWISIIDIVIVDT